MNIGQGERVQQPLKTVMRIQPLRHRTRDPHVTLRRSALVGRTHAHDRLTEERQTVPYVWVHPGEER